MKNTTKQFNDTWDYFNPYVNRNISDIKNTYKNMDAYNKAFMEVYDNFNIRKYYGKNQLLVRVNLVLKDEVLNKYNLQYINPKKKITISIFEAAHHLIRASNNGYDGYTDFIWYLFNLNRKNIIGDQSFNCYYETKTV